VRIEYGHSIRSPITVAGIVGQARSSSRIRGSTTSATQPCGWRRYAGGPSAANAFFTVFFEHPNTRAITLIGIRSARYSRRISAQSSTLNTHFLLTSTEVSITEGVSFQLPLRGQFSGAVDTRCEWADELLRRLDSDRVVMTLTTCPLRSPTGERLLAWDPWQLIRPASNWQPSRSILIRCRGPWC
jgi:hypothetical protein